MRRQRVELAYGQLVSCFAHCARSLAHSHSDFASHIAPDQERLGRFGTQPLLCYFLRLILEQGYFKMTRLRKQETSIVSLAMLFTLFGSGAAFRAAVSQPLASFLMLRPALAQAASTIAFPLPTNVPVGTSIRIGGSSSMETINQALKRHFEQQFVGTKVELNTQGTGPAIKDLLDGNADLAAIGRTLMEQEKAQGLVPVPVSRHKIAIIVGSENPFKGSLTFEQFAKIFRGEIKDWAQVGGEPGPIRFIDRPDNSDTRQAFRNYSVFKQAPFMTGTTARQVQDSTSQVVQELRTDGIGYAIADQLQGHGDVRVIPMHKTLPSNPKYPFSQPLIYVYKGLQPNPAAQAFLGYATAPISRQTIETARKEATAAIATNLDVASPGPKVTPSQASPSAIAAPPTVEPPSADAGLANPAIWWLLAIPLLGGLFWWLLKRNAEPELEASVEGIPAPAVDPVATVKPQPVVEPTPDLKPLPTLEPIAPLASMVAPLLGASQPAGDSRLILVPRDYMNADAYWEIPASAHAWLQQQGAQKLVLRLYDVTGIDINQQPPASLQEFDCDAQAYDRHLPIRAADRTYLAELGYVVAEGRWLQVARSEPVYIPACPAVQPAIAPDTGDKPSSLMNDSAPVDDALQSSGRALANGAVLANGAATSPVIAADRADWSPSDGSNRLTRTPLDRALQANSTALDGAVLVNSPGVAASLLSDEADGMSRDRPLDGLLAPSATISASSVVDRTIANGLTTSQSQMRLIPRTAHDLYVSWNAIQAEKDALKQQGGQQLVLRVYAITGTDTSLTHNVQQCFCNDWDHDQSVPIAVSNLDYVAELGYTTLDGRFLMLARSPQTRVPGA